MPDFRARVHRGETFVIAGDRFAIGSSREMSPAGLKAIAEEVGLEMVIICGNNMGDIFRRNSFNLGLHVVQSPEAVADARDGDDVHVRSGVAPDRQRHAGQDLRPGAAERERGRDPPERRHLRRRPPRVPRVGRAQAGDRVSRRRAARARCRRPRRSSGRIASTRTRRWRRARRCASTPICCRHPTAPRRFRSTPSTRSPAATRSIRARPPSPTITSSSPARKTTTSRRRSARSSRRSTASRSRTTRPRATAFFISIFPSRAWCCPGSSFPAPTRIAAPTAPTARSAWASVRRRSGSDGRRATSTSRWRTSAASRSAASSAPGSPARTSSSSCCAAGARSSRRACRWSWSTATSSCRSRFATPSPT